MPAHHTPTLTASRFTSRYRLYLIKTIPHREERSLARILPRYVRHVERFPHTLLPRFMGAHRLILPGVGKVHFVVTSNLRVTTSLYRAPPLSPPYFRRYRCTSS